MKTGVRNFVIVAAAAAMVGGVGSVAQVEAAPVTAYEVIFDTLPVDPFTRDLERQRGSDLMGTFDESDDATIAAQNSVNNDFGLVNIGTVTYTHDLSWLNPPPASFMVGTLTILAWGNIAGDDVLFADTIELGPLNNSTVQTLGFSTTGYDVTAWIADGLLNVMIDKNVGGGLRNLNAFSVVASALQVQYEAVPEPGTLALFGLGLAACARAARRRRGQGCA